MDEQLINVYKILDKTSVEGPGVRFCLWVQGCKNHCSGCFATETWDFEKGKIYTVEQIFSRIYRVKDKIEGVTFLGGEPFEQAKALSKLAKLVKGLGLSVVCFTGYTIEELYDKKSKEVDEFLSMIDLLIDGGFEKDKFDISRPWVGSSNQRYIFLTDKYNKYEILEYRNKIEIRLNQDGKMEINGMGDFSSIEENFCLQLGKDSVK